MKQISYTLNGLYRAIPETAQLPVDAENVQVFDDLAGLQASQDYIDYIASQVPVIDPRQALKDTRDADLQAMTFNGLNTRPQDLANFQTKISLMADGTSTKWSDENDNTVTVTKQDLIDAMTHGLITGEAIWDTYHTANEAL